MANGKDTSMDDQVDAKLERRGVFFLPFLSVKPFFEIEIYKYPLYISLKTSASSYRLDTLTT